MAGDGKYITIAEARRTSGISSTTDISDSDVGEMIAEVEKQIARYYNTVFTPKEIIEERDGNGSLRLILRRNPVLAVRDLYIDGTQEDTANVEVYKESGKIELNSDATVSTFKSGQKKIIIKYLFGWLEESDTSTTTTAASTASTSVSLAVSSITGFSDEDWCEIYSMDGHREVFQISGDPAGTTIVADQLIKTHESGSVVVKLQVNEVFKKLMRICSALSMVARFLGQSYTDIVGYNLGEMRVQKGEPYTQWRETAVQLIKERDDILGRIKPRPAIM